MIYKIFKNINIQLDEFGQSNIVYYAKNENNLILTLSNHDNIIQSIISYKHKFSKLEKKSYYLEYSINELNEINKYINNDLYDEILIVKD